MAAFEGNPSSGLRKNAAIFGVILGALSVVTGIISLVLMKDASTLLSSTFLAFVVQYGTLVAVACFFVVRLRKLNSGYWDFRTALSTIFIMLAVAGILSTVVTVVLTSKVLPHLQEDAIDNMMNLTIEAQEAAGLSDEQIDGTIEQLELQKEQIRQISVGMVIKGIAVSLLFYFVFALILAAIFKKEEPVFFESKDDGAAHPWQDDAQA